MPERINVYTCGACREQTTTVDVDEGVTPLILHRPWAKHREGCGGQARSSCYRPPPVYPEPTAEWYRMTDEEARAMSPAMQEHHRQGGLNIRPRLKH